MPCSSQHLVFFYNTYHYLALSHINYFYIFISPPIEYKLQEGKNSILLLFLSLALEKNQGNIFIQ